MNLPRKITFMIVILLFLTIITACASPAATSPTIQTEAPLSEPTSLSIMTHGSFAISEELVQAFERENNVKLTFLASGDTGTALNKAILTRNTPLADVFYGVDNTFLSRALDEDIFEPYTSPLLSQIPPEFQLDPQNRLLPVDYGDVCLNYDRAYFTEHNLAPPQNLEDLLAPQYRSLLVVQNPATSSPGLAFLLSTVSGFGEDGYLAFWEGLVENDVLVVNDWETAYNAEFTRAGGTRPIVVSYASSPAFEVIYADPPVSEPPTGVVTGPGSCFRQIEFVGILNGTPKRALAEKWVDFMLSTPFQEAIPLQMWVFPVNTSAGLDEAFVKFLATPEAPAVVDPAAITAHREDWIQAWTEVVLR